MENSWLSPYNLEPDVLKPSFFPKTIKTLDTTLRDGEQTVGVVFSAQEKLQIAKELAKAGVDRIEAGMPVVSGEDRLALEMIASEVKDAEVWGFSRCVKGDIDACKDAGVKYITCEIPFSDYKLNAYGFTLEKVLARMLESVSYAKEIGLYTAFFAVDATRTPLDVLEKAFRMAVEKGGADEIVLCDTLGVASPETMYYLTRKVIEWTGVPVMVHCHNEFGLGTACSLAAVKAGAETVQGTINGLGEKTGNADLIEVVFGVNVLYQLPVKVDLKLLRHLSDTVASISGIPVSQLKPIVGERVFQRESGAVVAQIDYPPAIEGFSPDLIGSQREIFLGKKSGKNSIEYKLNELKLEANDDQIKQLLDRVKKESIRKRGVLTEDEFVKIVKEIVS